jgi:hypothetical protein
MRLRFAIISAITFISIKLIRLNTRTKHKDSFNIIGKRYNCFIKLPPLKIKKLAYKDIISKQ